MDINWYMCNIMILNPEGQTSIAGSSRVDKFEQAQKVSIDIKDYSITEWLSYIWVLPEHTHFALQGFLKFTLK